MDLIGRLDRIGAHLRRLPGCLHFFDFSAIPCMDIEEYKVLETIADRIVTKSLQEESKKERVFHKLKPYLQANQISQKFQDVQF
jgi:hypothetical protein